MTFDLRTLLLARRAALRSLAHALKMPSRANKTLAQLQAQRRERRTVQRTWRKRIVELEKMIIVEVDRKELGDL